MADNPDIQWALEMLEPYQEQNFVYKNMPYIINFGVGVGFACYWNFIRNRPLHAGIQQHILYGIGYSAVLGTLYTQVVKYKREKHAAVTRDYIIKHPEDFPSPKPKKWAEVFEPWLPIR